MGQTASCSQTVGAIDASRCGVLMHRPYLHVHATSTERETQIINLSKATIKSSPELEALLGVSLTLKATKFVQEARADV